MDAERFDHLSRLLVLSGSRRRMLGRAGKLLGASLGLTILGSRPGSAQDDGDSPAACIIELVANVRVSPEGIVLIPGDEDTLQAELRFSTGTDGALEDAVFVLDGGGEHAVAGQVDGHSFAARVDFLPGRTLVFVGVALFPIEECRGAIDGLITGPQMGALGDWHATMRRPEGQPAAAATPVSDAGAETAPGGSGLASETNGGSDEDEETNGGSEASGETAGDCTLTCTGGRVLDSESCECDCPAALDDCGDLCVDQSSDAAHCGACGNACPENAECVDGSCECPVAVCNPGAVTDPETCECVCPESWTDCGEECCQPGVACAGTVCCHPEGTTCTIAETCCSGTCDFLVGGGTCAPCLGRTCGQAADCCGGLPCVNGYCGGCRDRATACTDSSQCCFSDCFNGACLSDDGGRCARNVDCRDCYLNGQCQRACLLGVCGGSLLPDTDIPTLPVQG